MSGYGGGGFMSGSQTTPDNAKRAGPSSLRPVTIAQILNAEQSHNDAEFIIDGQEAKDISIVACIRNFSKTSTNLVMQIEDGTGQVDARKWIVIEEESSDEAIEVNTYVRITGTLKSFQGKRHVACSTISRVEDKNEILFHIVETIAVHLYFTRGPPNVGENGGGANNQQIDRKPVAQHTTAAAQEAYSDLPPLQRKIMQHYSTIEDVPDEGMHISILLNRAVPGLSMDKLREEITSLADSGYVYYTIDDDHVAPSNS